jgi:septal ring factor EnvC (AmiA/AmiB activator)
MVKMKQQAGEVIKADSSRIKTLEAAVKEKEKEREEVQKKLSGTEGLLKNMRNHFDESNKKEKELREQVRRAFLP